MSSTVITEPGMEAIPAVIADNLSLVLAEIANTAAAINEKQLAAVSQLGV